MAYKLYRLLEVLGGEVRGFKAMLPYRLTQKWKMLLLVKFI